MKNCCKEKKPYSPKTSMTLFIILMAIVLFCLLQVIKTHEVIQINEITAPSPVRYTLTVPIPKDCPNGPNRIKQAVYGRIPYTRDIIVFQAEMVCDDAAVEILEYTQYLSIPSNVTSLTFKWEGGNYFSPHELTDKT